MRLGPFRQIKEVPWGVKYIAVGPIGSSHAVRQCSRTLGRIPWTAPLEADDESLKLKQAKPLQDAQCVYL